VQLYSVECLCRGKFSDCVHPTHSVLRKHVQQFWDAGSVHIEKCVMCKCMTNEANEIALLVAVEAIAHTSTRQLQ
jgi:hypothetical protein